METVIESKQVKEWQGKPIYFIGLSDGRGGESFQNIPVGTPMNELNIEQSNYGLKIKHNKPNQGGGGFGGGGRKQSGNESFACAYSKDIAVAYIGQGKEISPQKVVDWAEVLYNWMEGKKAK